MLRFAILELLDHRPLSGYELKRRFNGSIVFFWHANQSQIYRELRKMEKAGLIVGHKVTHQWRPTKTVYQVTPKGRAEAVAWLGKAPKLQAIKDEMMLKCFAFNLISDGEAEAQIEHHRGLHQKQLDFYSQLERQLEERHGPLSRTRDPILFWNAQCLYHAIEYERMYLEWCARTLERHRSFKARAQGAAANAAG
ncbi:MAG TPA: PadR family transcriptional regulator [Candidatus Binataceae bacterium]|nr:PadR family transcriptional regulator [Candidatus Binataceae bacterium]